MLTSAIEPAAFTKVSALGVEEQRVNVIGDLIDSALLIEGMNPRRGERPVVLSGVPGTGKSYLHSATPLILLSCLGMLTESILQS